MVVNMRFAYPALTHKLHYNLRWMHWMRGEVKFASQEELTQALHLDREKARTLLAGCKPGGL